MKKSSYFVFLICFMLLVFILNISSAQSSYSLEKALKVMKLIEKVDSEKGKPFSGPLRQVKVTERELNSYLAFRIEHEEDVMKGLSLKLFDENRLEGKVLLRFEGKGLPSILRPEMAFYFNATLEVRERAVRLKINELFLNKEPVNPMVLDTVIYLSSKFQGTENMSLNDWYELPYGIKDVRIEKGSAVFFY